MLVNSPGFCIRFLLSHMRWGSLWFRSGQCGDIHGRSLAKFGYNVFLASKRRACSGLWGLNNQNRLGFFGRCALKKQELKQSGQKEKNNVFFFLLIKACKGVRWTMHLHFLPLYKPQAEISQIRMLPPCS